MAKQDTGEGVESRKVGIDPYSGEVMAELVFTQRPEPTRAAVFRGEPQQTP